MVPEHRWAGDATVVSIFSPKYHCAKSVVVLHAVRTETLLTLE
jgi:hypothetical protein